MSEIEKSENLKRYAHIVKGTVVNVSVWDGVNVYQPVEKLVEIPEGSAAGPGWDYVGGKFVDNRPVEAENEAI
jgi:hypothetical protein